MRFLADENFPQPAVDFLRILGHDVLTVLESGKAGQGISDADILAFATENLRAVITMNRKHFIQLHENQPQHAGIIVCTVDPNNEALAQRIHTIVEARSELTGQLLRVNRPN